MTEEQQRSIFKDWLQQQSHIIFKIARAYTESAMDRDDLFQDIALQVWHSVPKFKAQSTVVTWIYRIALNTALKWVRKAKYQKTEPLESAQFILHEPTENIDEQLKWLYREIYSLDPIDRCLVLLLLDSMSYRDMAAILGISESNVGIKISRIKKYLTEQSKKHGHYGV